MADSKPRSVHDAGRNPAAAKRQEVWGNALWELQQKLAREDYIGAEPDLYQLRRDLMSLATILHALLGGDDDEA